MIKNEKNESAVNNSSCTGTFAHEMSTQPISPVLTDCLQKLREVFHSIIEFYGSKPAIRECLIHDLGQIEDSLGDAAHHIVQMAASELLENAYYQEAKEKNQS
jgi:hypothetical protein